MRITGGNYKGRKLPILANGNLRPTTDFAREALFNILVNKIDFDNSTLLDLFAGTGTVSFEFISRNIKHATAIEINKIHTKYIKSIKDLLCVENFDILNIDVFLFLQKNTNTFDIIFADPPYNIENMERIPNIIFDKQLITQNGILVVEHGVDNNFTKHINFVEQRKYGAVNFSFFKLK